MTVTPNTKLILTGAALLMAIVGCMVTVTRYEWTVCRNWKLRIVYSNGRCISLIDSFSFHFVFMKRVFDFFFSLSNFFRNQMEYSCSPFPVFQMNDFWHHICNDIAFILIRINANNWYLLLLIKMIPNKMKWKWKQTSKYKHRFWFIILKHQYFHSNPWNSSILKQSNYKWWK